MLSSQLLQILSFNMNSSDDDSQPDDPIVAFRSPQNRVGVRTRRMAFTAVSIRIRGIVKSAISNNRTNNHRIHSIVQS